MADRKIWDKRYVTKHRDRVLASKRKWNNSNKGKSNRRTWDRKNMSRKVEWQRIYEEKLRKKILEHYGGIPPRCACCGETTYLFLQLDHINNDGFKDRKRFKSNRSLYVWLIRNHFPQGYQILCANCNYGKKVNHGICPHKI